MLQLASKYQIIFLEALEELMYQLSLQLEESGGKPLDKGRKQLTKKLAIVEKLQHWISTHDHSSNEHF